MQKELRAFTEVRKEPYKLSPERPLAGAPRTPVAASPEPQNPQPQTAGGQKKKSLKTLNPKF